MAEGRILVVDNDPQIRRVMRTTLVAQGFEVSDARNGEEAMERVRDGKFDLVVLDINMPGLNGIEVCKEIRRDFGHGHHHAHRAEHRKRQD